MELFGLVGYLDLWGGLVNFYVYLFDVGNMLHWWSWDFFDNVTLWHHSHGRQEAATTLIASQRDEMYTNLLRAKSPWGLHLQSSWSMAPRAALLRAERSDGEAIGNCSSLWCSLWHHVPGWEQCQIIIFACYSWDPDLNSDWFFSEHCTNGGAIRCAAFSPFINFAHSSQSDIIFMHFWALTYS